MRLAAEGASVAVVDVRLDAAQETASTIAEAGGIAVAFDADVRERMEVESARDGALAALGHIRYLVNNAGLVRMSTLDELEEDEWDLVLDTNLKSMYVVTRAVAPAIGGGGRRSYREHVDDRGRGRRRFAGPSAGPLQRLARAG